MTLSNSFTPTEQLHLPLQPNQAEERDQSSFFLRGGPRRRKHLSILLLRKPSVRRFGKKQNKILHAI